MPHLNLASHGITDILTLQVMGYLQHYFLLVLWIGQLFKHVKQVLFCWASFPVSDCVHVCMCNTCVSVYDVWYMCVHFCERVDTVRPLPACGKQRTIAGVSSCLPPCQRQTFVTMHAGLTDLWVSGHFPVPLSQHLAGGALGLQTCATVLSVFGFQGSEFSSSGLHGKHFYPLAHLPSPNYTL